MKESSTYLKCYNMPGPLLSTGHMTYDYELEAVLTCKEPMDR